MSVRPDVGWLVVTFVRLPVRLSVCSRHLKHRSETASSSGMKPKQIILKTWNETETENLKNKAKQNDDNGFKNFD